MSANFVDQLLGYFRDVMAAAVGCPAESFLHAAPERAARRSPARPSAWLGDDLGHDADSRSDACRGSDSARTAAPWPSWRWCGSPISAIWTIWPISSPTCAAARRRRAVPRPERVGGDGKKKADLSRRRLRLRSTHRIAPSRRRTSIRRTFAAAAGQLVPANAPTAAIRVTAGKCPASSGRRPWRRWKI